MKQEKNEKVEKNTIVVQPLKLTTTAIKLRSIAGSTYISHRLGKETMKGIEDRVTGKAEKGRHKIRDFDAEYESCFYKTPEGKYGIPACAFSGAILDAAVACNIPKTQIKRAVRVLGDVYELSYENVRRRIDYPRQSGVTKAPDIRHRPEFINWECEIIVQYDQNLITPDQLVNLIEQAGFSSGVGDWRPSSPKNTGSHGMFEIIKK